MDVSKLSLISQSNKHNIKIFKIMLFCIKIRSIIQFYCKSCFDFSKIRAQKAP